MLQLLLGAGLLYLVLGDLAEALILLGLAVLNVILVTVQEGRTEKALAALKDLTSPRALVIRGGGRQRIAARDLVVNDVIVLSEGDRVPADAMLVEATHLEADESLLTGESVPVRKAVRPATRGEEHPGGDETWIGPSSSGQPSRTGNSDMPAIGTWTART